MTNTVKLELTEDDFRAIIVLLGRGSTDDTFFVRANLILRLEQQGMPQLTPVEASQQEASNKGSDHFRATKLEQTA